MTTRRKFVRILAFAAGTILWPAAWLKAKTTRVAFSLSKVKKLSEIGGWAILKLKGKQILFVRDSEKSVRAIDSICRHKECTVEYNPESKLIVCPCHGSTYDLDGKVLKPPAEQPLPVYETVLTDDRVVVTLDGLP